MSCATMFFARQRRGEPGGDGYGQDVMRRENGSGRQEAYADDELAGIFDGDGSGYGEGEVETVVLDNGSGYATGCRSGGGSLNTSGRRMEEG